MREKTTTLGHQMAGVLHLRLSIERQGESLSKKKVAMFDRVC